MSKSFEQIRKVLLSPEFPGIVQEHPSGLIRVSATTAKDTDVALIWNRGDTTFLKRTGASSRLMYFRGEMRQPVQKILEALYRAGVGRG